MLDNALIFFNISKTKRNSQNKFSVVNVYRHQGRRSAGKNNNNKLFHAIKIQPNNANKKNAKPNQWIPWFCLYLLRPESTCLSHPNSEPFDQGLGPREQVKVARTPGTLPLDFVGSYYEIDEELAEWWPEFSKLFYNDSRTVAGTKRPQFETNLLSADQTFQMFFPCDWALSR